jgi:hypothetical protein
MAYQFFSIKSSIRENTVEKGSLVARDFFVPGSLVVSNVHVISKSLHICSNVQQFKKEHLNIIVDWF